MERDGRLTRTKLLLILSSLGLVTVVTALISLTIGSVDISLAEIFAALKGEPASDTNYQILFKIRLPRILLAIAVGGGLSVCGAVYQSILKNPLAEPYILGVSSGGAFGAVLSFMIGASFFGTQVFAYAGAFSVIFLVFFLGRRFGELDPNILLLTGVMVGSFFHAVNWLMLSFIDESLRNAIFWIIGNLSSADYSTIIVILPISIIVSFMLSVSGYKYNVMSLGDDHAKQLGIDIKKLKNFTYVFSSILVGAVVSVSGLIGFVGLIIPHICRLIFGVDNRIVIPASFFVGAVYLTFADVLARTLIAPSELPVGSITALIGAPVFIYILKKKYS